MSHDLVIVPLSQNLYPKPYSYKLAIVTQLSFQVLQQSGKHWCCSRKAHILKAMLQIV